MSLVLQAEHMGLRCHQMAGWEQGPARGARHPGRRAAHRRHGIGYEGDPADLEERTREKEAVPRTQRPLGESAFRDRWRIE